MVRILLVSIFIVSTAQANFVETDEGRNLIALQDKIGRGLYDGEIYHITNVIGDHHADINSTGVGIHYNHKGLFWDWLHDYTINQQVVDTISFASGVLLFMVFTRGFSITPF
tara:strand:- start:5 stop:340 length:336 start_codon:yes stop_codon:yes gene_type:complete